LFRLFSITIPAVIVAISAILLTGCGGGDKYIIKGLTLPAGSTVKSEDDSTAAANMGMAGLGGHGPVEQAVAVMFDSNLDWNAVCSHIGGCVAKAGLKDSSTLLNEMGGMDLPPEALKMMAGTIKLWANPDEGYVVELVNTAGLRGLAGGAMPPSLGDADYTLVVIKADMSGAGSGKTPTGMGI